MLFFPGPADPAQTADLSQMAEEVNKAENAKSALAPAVDPGEHGVTGPESKDPGKAEGVVGGQAEREKDVETPPAADEPPAEEKPGEEPPAEEEFEEFEITLSDDALMSQEEFDALMDIVEKKGFTKEEAENLIKTQEGALEAGSKLVHDARAAEAEANRKSLIADPLFEGDFEGALKVMKAPVQAFGDEDFNALLQSEIGNHPSLGRFIYRLGKAMESEGFVGKGGKPPEPPKTTGQIMYPSFYEKA